MTARPARHDASARSPFTGQYVHELLGLALSAHGPRPLFDDDRWDLRGAQGAPIQVNPGELDWDFTEIPRPLWRLLVREFVVALRAPHHERITRLPWARREPLSLRTCAQRRFFAVAWGAALAGVERRSGFRCGGVFAALGIPMWRVPGCLRVSVRRRRHLADERVPATAQDDGAGAGLRH